MSADLWIIAQLLFWMSLVFYLGWGLAGKGEDLARVTGLGGSWVGLIFLACATSMPELITGLSTAGLVKEPDLALGNIFGSCLFNLSIIAVLDLLVRKGPVLLDVESSQILPGILGVVIIGVGTLGLFVVPRYLAYPWRWAFGAALLILYVVSIQLIRRYCRTEAEPEKRPEPGDKSKGRVYVDFGIWAVLLIGAALALSFTGDKVATHKFGGSFQFGTTIVGTIFLAFATSLPELSVSIASVRNKNFRMAVGNVLGSNLFNLAVIPASEIAATIGGGAPVLVRRLGEPQHLITGGVSMLLTLVVVLAIWRRPKVRIGWVGLESVFIGVVYLGTMVALFYLR